MTGMVIATCRLFQDMLHLLCLYITIYQGESIMAAQVKVGFFVFSVAIAVASALTVLSKLA
jgi:hypothetical protein